MRPIAVFIGTRPEAIKMAPVVAALARSDQFQPLVVNTGQHRELIEQVIHLFGIHVDRDLAVMLHILGKVDRAHTSAAQLTHEAVAVAEGVREPCRDFAHDGPGGNRVEYGRPVREPPA